MSAPRLLHVGSAVVDYIYRIDALPAPGTEKTAATYEIAAGGGFNMMVAATRTGLPVAYGGQHGTGRNGDFLRDAFAREGIDVLTPPSPDMDSGNCVVLVTADAERTFVSWPGAEGHLGPARLPDLKVRPGDWLFATGYTLSYPGSRDAVVALIESLPAANPLVFDPTPVVAEIPQPLLSRVLARTTWLSCNTDEAAAIAGIGEGAAARLLDVHCPNAAGVVIRSGAAGCLVCLRDGSERAVPGFQVEAIDTNGAGDTHIGAFVSALARGADPFEGALYANAAAAISVTRRGGASAPTDAEIQEFLVSARRAPRKIHAL
jgi:sugar/nucleoside kinase (ribokinase family)